MIGIIIFVINLNVFLILIINVLMYLILIFILFVLVVIFRLLIITLLLDFIILLVIWFISNSLILLFVTFLFKVMSDNVNVIEFGSFSNVYKMIKVLFELLMLLVMFMTSNR